jgi:hypothetical protein
MTMKWVDAWQQLVYEHSPFKAVDDDDFQSLLRQLSELERLFLTTPELASYSAEWRTATHGASGAPSRTAQVPAEHRWMSVHVAAIQLQLMEDAFYSLRLDRYANAPDNRGWMNLFRQWSASPTFRQHVDALDATFSRQFIEFYRHYIEGLDIDEPVPHPWDLRAAERHAPLSYEGVTKNAVDRCVFRAAGGGGVKGIFLDPGLVEAGSSDAYEEPEPIVAGQHGAPPPSPPPVAPPSVPPAAKDSSKSTD